MTAAGTETTHQPAETQLVRAANVDYTLDDLGGASWKRLIRCAPHQP
jgi:hypothetical protein